MPPQAPPRLSCFSLCKRFLTVSREYRYGTLLLFEKTIFFVSGYFFRASGLLLLLFWPRSGQGKILRFAQNDKGTVILRSAATKNLSDHVSETRGKILCFAQNDKGTVILRSVATKNLSDHVSGTRGKILCFAQNDKGTVILRSAATKNLSDHVFETGEKILRFAQNDRGGGAE